MRILSRYVLKEFLVPLFYCLTGFISIYILFELFGSFSRLVEAKPTMSKTLLYFAGYFAPYFEWLAPACLMLATLYTMWNFCRHSEIIAMRASGISFFAIVKPLLLVACIMAGAVVWVGEVFVPKYAHWATLYKGARFKDSEMTRTDDIVYRAPHSLRTWKIGSVLSSTGEKFKDVKISIDYPGGGRKMTITSPHVEYLDGNWYFSTPVMAYYDTDGNAIASPTPELDKLTLRSFPDFSEKPNDFLMQNHDFKYFSTLSRWRYFKNNPTIDKERMVSYKYDFWAKIFAPLACLVITLFAIPAGIATGRQSVFKGIVGAIGMFFAFYALTIGCMIFAKKDILPPFVAAIFPNILFFMIGCRLFYKQR